MGQQKKTLDQILRGGSDQNVAFNDLLNLLKSLGFEQRIKGSHYVFSKQGVVEIINIQSSDNKAKSYQVKQIRAIILKYRLVGE